MAIDRSSGSRRDQGPPPMMGPGRGGPAARFMGEKIRPKDARGTIRRIWGYIAAFRSQLILAAVMLVAIAGLTVLNPWLLSKAIDDEIIPGDMDGLAVIVGFMAVSYVAQAFFQWMQAWIMASVAQRSVRQIRTDLFGRVQQLPLSTFDKRPHGDLMSRLTNDVDNINVVLTESFASLVTGLLMAVGVSIAMLVINWQLGLIVIVVSVGLTLFINRIVAPRTRSGFRDQQAALGDLNGLIEETITGQRVVKAHNHEVRVIDEFSEKNLRVRRAALRAQSYASVVGPSMNMVGNLSLLVVAFTGGWLAIEGHATVGVIAAFLAYTRQFGRPLNELASTYNTFQSAIAGAERVFAVIDEEPERDAPDALGAGRLRGDVRFEDVSFEYEEGRPILKHVNLHAEPGQVIALVGPTGAGKTTIVNLLSSFYDASAGVVMVDGVDIQRYRKDELRRQLGIVLQDTYMFSGTVRENIRYGRLEATDAEIEAAATMANADQFIRRLPHGYETVLSERAANVSQGQRQLLAIARAILADPAILILDEATSSVDTRTERTIQDAMLALMEGRTSFVIAHRLSTIRNADQILVVFGGEIIERGTHEELVSADGFYAGLVQSQFETELVAAS